MKIQIKLRGLTKDRYIIVSNAQVTSTHISGEHCEFICSGIVVIMASYAREDIAEFWVLEQGVWPELTEENA